MVSSLSHNGFLSLLLWQSKRTLSTNAKNPSFYKKISSLNLNLNGIQKKKEITDLHAVYNSFDIPMIEDVLEEELDLTKFQAKKILSATKELNKKNPIYVRHNIQTIKKYFSKPVPFDENSSFLICIMRMPPMMLNHRLCMMKELGIELTCDSVQQHRHICLKTVNELLRKNLIKKTVVEDVLKSLGVPDEVTNKVPTLSSQGDKKLIDYWADLTKIYLEWKIDLNEAGFLKLLKMRYYFMHRSLTLLSEVINIVKIEFGFDNEKIQSHSYLFAGVPEFLQDYVNYDKKIGGFEVKNIVKVLPMMLRRPLINTLQTEALLDYISLQPKHVTGTLSLFTYPPSTILSRIEFYVNKTSLSDLQLCPNNSFLLLHFDRCKKNLKLYEEEHSVVSHLPSPTLLYDPNISCPIKVKRAYFVRFMKIIFNIKPTDTYVALSQIRIIHYPDYGDIKENLVFLLHEGFSLKTIKGSFHLLFYPHDILTLCYSKDLFNSKYGHHFLKKKEKGKLLQLLLYKVNKYYITLGGAYG